TRDAEPGEPGARGSVARPLARGAAAGGRAARRYRLGAARRLHPDPGSGGEPGAPGRGSRGGDRDVRLVDRASARCVRYPAVGADRDDWRRQRMIGLVGLIGALRGAMAVGALATLVGGTPALVRLGLAAAVGLWSAALIALSP